MKHSNSEFFGKLSQAMKLKSQDLKGKLFEYIVNPTASANSSTEKKNDKDTDQSKREQNSRPVFSIDDDQDPGKCDKFHRGH